MSKHTPGPWRISMRAGCASSPAINPYAIQHGPAGNYIAIVAGIGGECGRNNLENARLIAAAPELLAALIDLVERCDGAEGVRADGSNIQTILAHAAIAKATGEA